jgi:ABC-type Fe3+-siderophore transport system permease subunit
MKNVKRLAALALSLTLLFLCSVSAPAWAAAQTQVDTLTIKVGYFGGPYYEKAVFAMDDLWNMDLVYDSYTFVDNMPAVGVAQVADIPKTWTDGAANTFFQIRLPRVTAAALIGAALSVAGAVLAGLGVLLCLRWRLNLLTVSDEEAESMGVNVQRLRSVVIVCATLMTAASVALAVCVPRREERTGNHFVLPSKDRFISITASGSRSALETAPRWKYAWRL